MKIILMGIVLFLFNIPSILAQSLVNGGFNLSSPNCVNNDEYSCSTFSSSCVPNWFRTHGRPQVVPENGTNNYRLDMRGYATCCATFGEGVAALYNFVQGREYRVKFYYSSGTGKLKFFAANGLTESNASCGSGYSTVPDISSKQLISEFVPEGPITTPPGDRFFTFTATGNFSQLWIYPWVDPSSSGDQYFGYIIDDVEITPNICTPDITYNLGLIPAGTLEFGHVTIGSSGGTGGSSTVTNNPNANTTIAAGNGVNFLPETILNANSGHEFHAYIRPCNFRVAINSTAPEVRPIVENVQRPNLPAGKKLRVYPNPTTTNRIWADVDLTPGSKISIRLLNTQGNVVRHIPPLNKGVGVQRIEVNMENLPRGIYLLQMLTETGLITEKIEKL